MNSMFHYKDSFFLLFTANMIPFIIPIIIGYKAQTRAIKNGFISSKNENIFVKFNEKMI